MSADNPGLPQSSFRRLLTVPIVVEIGLLGLFAFLLVNTLDPEFRGGRFVIATLLLGLAFLATVLARDVSIALWGRPVPPASASGPLGGEDDDEGEGVSWITVGEAAFTLAAVFLCIFVLGVVGGVTIAAWGIFLWQSKLSMAKALIGALLVGVVLPVLLALALDLTLWSGIIPEVIPDWVGGGLAPPL
jgi:hypothetical protein